MVLTCAVADMMPGGAAGTGPLVNGGPPLVSTGVAGSAPLLNICTDRPQVNRVSTHREYSAQNGHTPSILQEQNGRHGADTTYSPENCSGPQGMTELQDTADTTVRRTAAVTYRKSN